MTKLICIIQFLGPAGLIRNPTVLRKLNYSERIIFNRREGFIRTERGYVRISPMGSLRLFGGLRDRSFCNTYVELDSAQRITTKLIETNDNGRFRRLPVNIRRFGFW